MDNSEDTIQVDIFGLSLTPSISGGGYAIILKEIAGSRRIPIIIGQYEAQSIALELEGIKPPRPLTIAKSVPGFLIRLAAGSVPRLQGSENAGALLRKAETTLAAAMYRKRSWLQYQAELEPSRSDLDILAAFKDGDIAGLYPVFQPILHLATGAMASAEILVRWHHPRLGEVPPTTLVQVLENSGLIGRLTEIMIDHAVRVAASLTLQGKHCAISVNVAVHDLMEADLPRTIRAALARHEGRVEFLRLELTETGVASDPKRIKEAIDSLSDLGVSLSIDDFGTGFSSLAYLCNFPARDLKIDRSFVTDLLHDKRHSSIVRSTIAMASELGLETVAEGVEDQQTLDALRTFGCDYAQGFWIALPMTEPDFIAFLLARDKPT